MNPNRIAVWGDSITRGAWDEEQGGWVRRLHDYYAGHSNPTEVLNLGINGEKLAGLLDRFTREYVELDNPATVLIAIGINDSPHGYYAGTPPEIFKRGYEKLVDQATKNEARVVLVGLTNVIDRHRGHSGWQNDTIKPYDNIIRGVADSRNLAFVDLWRLIKPENLELDGLHPDAIGHQKIFQAVLKTLNDS